MAYLCLCEEGKAARLKVLKGTNSAAIIETVGIANIGYGAKGLGVAIPEALAQRIGFLPKFAQEARLEDYVFASGHSPSFRYTY